MKATNFQKGSQEESLITISNIVWDVKIQESRFQEEVLGGDIALETGTLPLHPASHPKLEALNRLHLPVIRAVEICLRGPDMGMAHQSLNGSEVIPLIQEGRGKGMPHDMRMNPLLDQGLFRHGFDKAINGFWGKASLPGRGHASPRYRIWDDRGRSHSRWLSGNPGWR